MTHAGDTAPSPAQPSAARLALTLGLVGFVAGLLLVAAHQSTLPRIQENQQRALERALGRVMPRATATRALELEAGTWRATSARSARSGVYAGYDDAGRLVGYAITASGAGFQDAIRLLFGVDVDRHTATGMMVLDSRETPGLGDKIVKDARFVGQFSGLELEPEVRVVKGGARAANEIDAITGATISSNAVARIINQASARVLMTLPEPGAAPALERIPAAAPEEAP